LASCFCGKVLEGTWKLSSNANSIHITDLFSSFHRKEGLIIFSTKYNPAINQISLSVNLFDGNYVNNKGVQMHPTLQLSHFSCKEGISAEITEEVITLKENFSTHKKELYNHSLKIQISPFPAETLMDSITLKLGLYSHN